MKRTRSTLIIILCWIPFFALAAFLFMNWSRWDWDVYREAALRLADGKDMYIGLEYHPYVYPPMLAQVLIPVVSIFDYDTSSFLWLVFNAVLLIASLCIINSQLPNARRQQIFWILPILFFPMLECFWLGQVSMIILFGATSAWIAVKKGHSQYAGGILALIAWLKVYPIFLLIYLIARRDWQALRGATIVSIVIVIFQIVVSGLNPLIHYFTVILPGLSAEGQMPILPRNNSILGFTYKLFIDTAEIIPLYDNASLASIARIVVTLLLVFGTVLLIRRPLNGLSEDNRFDFEYALVLIGAMLFGSTLVIEGMPPLWFAFVVVLTHRLSKPQLALIVLAFITISIYWPIMLGVQAGNDLTWVFLSSPFIAIAVLWIVIAMQRYSGIRQKA